MRKPILIILFARCLAAQQASIEGTAIDAVTRQPLPGVHINMHQDPAEDAWGAITRPNGRFSITGMKPALYFLTAEGNGYIHLPGKNVPLKPGDQVTGFIVEMTPRAVIAGRVLDEFGDPMQNVDVEATPVVPEPQLDEPGMSDRTDERGQFRMTGAPGKYYVKATYAPMRFVPAETFNGLPAPPAYAATFYPSSADKDRAHVVEVAPGHDLNGIDIRLARTLSLNISGVVTGVPDGSPPPLVWMEHDEARQYTQPALFDGIFRFSGLAPGHYRILASSGSGDNPLRSQLLDVHLESVDETNLNLKLMPGEELSGTLEIHGDPGKTTLLKTLAVHLEPESAPPPKGGAVDSDGAFHLSQIFPAKFRVTVRPLPENAYVDSVKLDDTEMPTGTLDLTRGAGGARLKVTVGLNSGQVEGTVLGEDGRPFAGPVAFVFLAATVDEIDNFSGKPIDPEAKFSFDGLRPGKYRLFAVDPRLVSSSLENFRALFPKGEEIEIREGDRLIKDVKVMAAENRDAKP